LTNPTEFGPTNAIFEIHFANRPDPARHYEHGHAHALVVRYRWFSAIDATITVFFACLLLTRASCGILFSLSRYDITGLDERSNENCKGIDVSRSRLSEILEAEHVSTGLPYSRMMLAGFSQGGALALFTGMQLPTPQALAGIVIMSGYMPAASQFRLTTGLQDVPILHCHGTMDPMVKYELAEKTKAKLVECGATDYTIKSFPIQHTVSPDELAHVQQFVRKVLPADDTFKIQLKDPSAMSVKELKAAIKKAGLGPQAVGFMEKSEFIRLLQDHRSGK
jgi:lysophospholipase-2